MPEEIILASASPRRRELMGYTGIPFVVEKADVDEVNAGTPEELVTVNARLKGEWIAKKHPGRTVLSADTLVYIEGRVLGKPKNKPDAVRMLSMLQNVWHEVYTGVTLISGGREETVCEVSRVHFVPLTEGEITRYVETGEPMDKAGAYALQGIGGMFVDCIEGSYSNVIGLPLARVREMLKAAGFEI